MSLLSDYRIRIKNLLAAEDIQQVLELEGVPAISARAIGASRAVIAQRSVLRRSEKRPDSRSSGEDDDKED